jgi:hypothetical protein
MIPVDALMVFVVTGILVALTAHLSEALLFAFGLQLRFWKDGS